MVNTTNSLSTVIYESVSMVMRIVLLVKLVNQQIATISFMIAMILLLVDVDVILIR